MSMRGVLIPAAVVLACLPSLRGGTEDLLDLPPGLRTYARAVASGRQGTPAKLQALLTATFQSQEQGGLGIVYDNDRTRTIQEVWTDRRANCLSLTLFFVGICRSLGIQAKYAEALNTNRWHRVGEVVHLEQHVVALIPHPPIDDLVADFLPRLHKRWGSYLVMPLTEERMRALYHSNRAVELLGQGLQEEALAQARQSLRQDPRSGVGWNIQGVVLRAVGENAQAEKSFREALALDPKDGAAIGNLEILLGQMGRGEEAQRFREMGQEIRKNDPYFNAFLAEEALASGNLEEAARRVAAALRIQPYESEFHLLHARLLLTQGRMDESMAAMELAQRWAKPGERERYDTKLEILRKARAR